MGLGKRIGSLLLAAIFCPGFSVAAADNVADLLRQAGAAYRAKDAATAGARLRQANVAATSGGRVEEILITELGLAEWCLLGGRTNSAIGHLESAARRHDGAGLPRAKRGIVLNTLGEMNLRLERYALAESQLETALDLLGREYGFYNPSVSFVQGALGTAQLANGNEKGAAENLYDAASNLQQMHVRQWIGSFAVVMKAQAKHYPLIVGYLSDYAQLLRRQGRQRTEGRRLEELERLIGRMFGKDSYAAIPVLWRRAYNAEARGYESSAGKHFRKALELAEKHREQADYRLAALRHLWSHCDRQGDTTRRDALALEISQAGGRPAENAAALKRLQAELFAYTFERRLSQSTSIIEQGDYTE